MLVGTRSCRYSSYVHSAFIICPVSSCLSFVYHFPASFALFIVLYRATFIYSILSYPLTFPQRYNFNLLQTCPTATIENVKLKVMQNLPLHSQNARELH